MSPGRNIFRPARPACGFKQDFRHSSSQSPAPCLVPPGPSTQQGLQLLSRHSSEGGCPCRKSSHRLLCLTVLELEASRRGTSCFWGEPEWGKHSLVCREERDLPCLLLGTPRD